MMCEEMTKMEKTWERDYSLLRPFDLEAAKAGEPLCSIVGSLQREFVAGPDASGRIVVSIEGKFNTCWPGDVRMSPLCWVEGRPVYKGDVLFWKSQPSSPCIAEKMMEDGWLAFRPSVTEPVGIIHPSGLTWQKPKGKREGWVNLYPTTYEKLAAISSSVYPAKEDADHCANSTRIACVRIEWEE